MSFDRSTLPKEILDRMFITQEDQNLILDKEMVLMEYFSRVDTRGKDTWDVIKNYNKFLFDQKISVLKMKNEHLKESNEFLITEVMYLKWVSAECIDVLKQKGVDTYAIIRDAKKKREEQDRQRKHMEEQKAFTKIESLK